MVSILEDVDMGNWRRVQIIGTCKKDEVYLLRKAISVAAPFHCLSYTQVICGLGDWAKENINVVGNLAERDYQPVDIITALHKYIVLKVPSLELIIRIGGGYESDSCVGVIKVKNEIIEYLSPDINKMPEISKDHIRKNMYRAMSTRT